MCVGGGSPSLRRAIVEMFQTRYECEARVRDHMRVFKVCLTDTQSADIIIQRGSGTDYNNRRV